MSKVFKYVRYIILGVIIATFMISNVNLYRPTYHTLSKDQSIIEHQLNYLDWTVRHDGPEMMQSLYPEGAFFLYSLYALSWIQYANKHEALNEETQSALEKARFGIKKMSSEFNRFEFLSSLNPPYGIFMCGWLNWAKGSYNLVARKLGGVEIYESEFKEASEQIAKAFEDSPTHYLQSYRGGAWPSDNVVAVASLKLHDELYEKKYDQIIDNWLSQVKQSLDTETGMIPYQSYHDDGTPIEGSHGNSQAVIIRFLAELDQEFTIEQYRLYNESYQKKMFGLLFTREIPIGIKGEGTIDSGPIIFGVGTAASIVSQIPYRIFQDKAQIIRILESLNACGFPMNIKNQTKYIMGVMPVADAFLVWGSLSEPYTESYEALVLNEPSNFWRLTYHFYSLLGILMVAILLHLKKVYRLLVKARSKLS